jgi:hypothetical protein
LFIERSQAKLELEALRNKCEIQKQLEECCCELKRQIVSTGSGITDLIISNKNDELRDALAQANLQLTVSKIHNTSVSS